MRWTAQQRGQRGFSLLEILVALSVMMVGMTSIMVLFAVGVTTHKKSINQMNAALAAESIHSELKARYTLYQIEQWKKKTTRKRSKKSKRSRVNPREFLADIPAKGKEMPEVLHFPGYHYRVTFTALDENGDAVLARIEIVWTKKGSEMKETYPVVLFKKPF